jgi:hypothetical protein
MNETPGMRPRYTTTLLFLLAFAVAGCGDSDGPRLAANEVAAAGDLRLTVDEAADLLAPVEGLPNDTEVVQALAEFWVDYALLALAVNEEGGLDRLDLSSIVDPQEKQSLVMKLREDVIDEDIEIDDAAVDTYWESDRPGEEVRARHILLMYPTDATQAQRDSVRSLAEDLRDRAMAGENFAALATEWSDDTGSAASGGDLDYFPRGIMVPPFEEAAFTTEPGEVSEIVESQFGLHVIRVEDRRRPELAEVREELRGVLRQERTLQAESIFVAGVNEEASIEKAENASEIMREVAGSADDGLPGRAGNQVLASYQGGRYTAADFLQFLRTQAPGLIPQIESASEEDLQGLLDQLLQSEVLVAEARRRGITADEEETRELEEGIREQYRQVAEAIGIVGIELEGEESLAEAVDRRILALMAQVVRGEAEVFPLQQLSMPLRNRYGYRIATDALATTVERVEARRAEGGLEVPEAPPEGLDLPEVDPPEGGDEGDEGGEPENR